MNKEQILANLDIASFYQTQIPSLKVNGKPNALGLCLFHDDHNPSLSVNVETGLFNCFSCGEKGDIFTFYQKLHGVDFPTALRDIEAMVGVANTSVKPKVVATFKYTNEDGEILYFKDRLEPGQNGRSKDFRFKHSTDNNTWKYERGCEAVLYNLPGILTAETVYFVEGEKKADLLNQWCLPATCLDSGANSSWKESYTQYFKGKQVVVFPDNDQPGRAYATNKIAQALNGTRPVKSGWLNFQDFRRKRT